MVRRLAKLHLECSSRIAAKRDETRPGVEFGLVEVLDRKLEGKISVGSVGGGIKVGSCWKGWWIRRPGVWLKLCGEHGV